MKDKIKFGYICLTDWNYEIDKVWNGTVIYPSLKALKKERKCIKECGIAKVKIVFVRTVKKERMG